LAGIVLRRYRADVDNFRSVSILAASTNWGILMLKTVLAAVALAIAVTTFAPVVVPVASDDASAQPAADRRTQPGSGQCRLSNGQKC
jgi:hypothetical protein